MLNEESPFSSMHKAESPNQTSSQFYHFHLRFHLSCQDSFGALFIIVPKTKRATHRSHLLLLDPS